MQKLILEKYADSKSYRLKGYLGDTISMFSYFTNNLWLENIYEYIEWASDPDEWCMSINVAQLEKEGDYILIGSELSDQKDGGPFFKISIDEFVRLLPELKKLVDQGVQEITIIETEDKKIEISGG